MLPLAPLARPAISPGIENEIELVSKLGSGGMGEVFLVRRWSAGIPRLFALKRLLPELADEPYFRQMFLDEARVTASLDHPNVCQVFDVVDNGATLYLLMEYIDGPSLADLYRAASHRGVTLDVRLIVGLIAQAAEGLHDCHEARDAGGAPLELLHRDITPTNLLVSRHGFVKLLDFGVAKARGAAAGTQAGVIKGKPAYVAPEVLSGEPASRRSDIFALAAVTWELLAGRRLFHRGDLVATARAVMAARHTPLSRLRADVPPRLCRAISRGLERDPDRRFSSARELGRALSLALERRGGPMAPPEIAAHLAGLDDPADPAGVLAFCLQPGRRGRRRAFTPAAVLAALVAGTACAITALL